MKTLFIVISLAMWAPQALFAQTDAPEVRDAIYQVFVGEFDRQSDMSRFEPLRALGFLRPFSIVDETGYALRGEGSSLQRVYVGPYLGKETAEAVMAKAWTLGFRDARIETNEQYLNSDKNADLTYTLQLGAFGDPDMRNFEEIASLPAHGVYLMYEDGLFKVLCGMYRPEQLDYLRRSVTPYLRDMGNYGFVRTFRAPLEFAGAD